jgi:hypothetical protein
MILKDTGGTAYTPPPSGTHMAKCVRLIDLGTQTSDFQGEAKTARKLLLAFELVGDLVRDDGEPFVVSKRFTASLHEKAALRKTLASWRGRDFNPTELQGFDLATVLGKPCMVSLIDVEKDGKQFVNIAGVMAAPRGVPVPEARTPVQHFSMDSPDWGVFATLSTRLVEQMELSPEFKRLKVPARIPVPQAPAPAMQELDPAYMAGAGSGSGFDDMTDDGPF